MSLQRLQALVSSTLYLRKDFREVSVMNQDVCQMSVLAVGPQMVSYEREAQSLSRHI